MDGSTQNPPDCWRSRKRCSGKWISFCLKDQDIDELKKVCGRVQTWTKGERLPFEFSPWWKVDNYIGGRSAYCIWCKYKLPIKGDEDGGIAHGNFENLEQHLADLGWVEIPAHQQFATFARKEAGEELLEMQKLPAKTTYVSLPKGQALDKTDWWAAWENAEKETSWHIFNYDTSRYIYYDIVDDDSDCDTFCYEGCFCRAWSDSNSIIYDNSLGSKGPDNPKEEVTGKVDYKYTK
ncbi:hypothetical protein NOR_08067 [Metarhizium rileyi]|uniref:Uncharacterized protein n=1 Tax=Metarhizium rileyi (strain RCEF 4871) TaxID=1649241 RepID=A0A166X114_METRR|nr:hypothetical protein NOR_08067 [Metarhizium rileyi RCEF 4871]